MTRRSFAHYRILLYAGEDGSIDIPYLLGFLGLSRRTLNKYIAWLKREGLVEKKGDKVYLTPLGLKLARILRLVRNGATAPRYVLTDPATGTPLAVSFANYAQLYALLFIDLVDKQVVEYHLSNYMENWFRVLGDEYIVEIIRTGRVKTANDLKSYLEKILAVAGVIG